jgi:hypothetical protein
LRQKLNQEKAWMCATAGARPGTASRGGLAQI